MEPDNKKTAGRESVPDARITSGWKSRKDKSDRGRDKKYSLTKATKKAADDLKGDLDKAVGAGAYFLAVLKFIGKMIYVLFRSVWRVLVGMSVVVLCCCVAGLLGIGYLYASSASELPDLEDYTRIAMPQDSTIYDRDNNVIGIISTVERTPVGFGQISQPLKDAVVSIEDERFYNHEGVDLMGIARALKTNYESWRSGGSATAQGASTITQQYVRNAYDNVGTEQTISRKLTEMMLAAQLEASMSKDDILNSYLNTVYFGNGCYGVEAASRHYFGHGADTLDVYESAVLASILNAPSVYDPETEDGRKETAERANLVIDKMYSLGKLGDISQEDLRALKRIDINEKLHITQRDRVINQPYYYDYVRAELAKYYPDAVVESGGWQIYTTLSIAEGDAAADIVRGIDESYGNGVTCAIADIDIETGAINSFCGGTDYAYSQYNIATSGHLQTGSALKPVLYAAACEYDGYYMSDQMDCTPVDIGSEDNPHVITPYLKGSSGTFKQGLIASDNAMAIHTAQTIGMADVQKMAAAVGITDPIEDNVVAVIGGQTNGLTPLEMATAYATIGNGGQANAVWCISSISDNLGNEVYKHESKPTYAMSSEVAAQVTDAMVAAVDEAGWYNIPYDKMGWTIAAKTGTTNDDIDSWCCGFNGTRAVAVWMGGRDEQIPVYDASSNTTHAFSDYFVAVGADDPKVTYEKPQYKTMIPEFSETDTYETYTTQAKDKRFTVNTEYVMTDSDQEGAVVAVIDEGKLVARGSAITIQVARDMVSVPDFTDMTPAEAFAAAGGLSVSFNVEYSSSGRSEPYITGQSREAGELVSKGSGIVLNVVMLDLSKDSGSETIQVPYLGSDSAMKMLMDERDALKKQNDAMRGEIESINERNSNQDRVQIVPNLTGLEAGQARQVLLSMGLRLSYSGASDSIVVSTSPSAGAEINENGVVTLYTSSSGQSSNTNSDNSENSGNSSNSSQNANTRNN